VFVQVAPQNHNALCGRVSRSSTVNTYHFVNTSISSLFVRIKVITVVPVVKEKEFEVGLYGTLKAIFVHSDSSELLGGLPKSLQKN